MTEIYHVRRFPAVAPRVESGTIMFGEDWPGMFLRGCDAHLFSLAVREIVLDDPDIGLITKRTLMGLLAALEGANASHNDAYPSWHEPGE